MVPPLERLWSEYRLVFNWRALRRMLRAFTNIGMVTIVLLDPEVKVRSDLLGWVVGEAINRSW